MNKGKYGDAATFVRVRQIFETCSELTVTATCEHMIEVEHHNGLRCHMVRVYRDNSKVMLDLLERACWAMGEVPRGFWDMMRTLFPGPNKPQKGQCGIVMMPIVTEYGAMDLNEYYTLVLQHAFETLWGACANSKCAVK